MFKITEVYEIMLKKIGAFTLAEVLITLAIIGIVAALTLPNLIYSYKKRIIETRLVHFSSMFRQAIQMAEAEYGETTTWDGFEIDDADAMLESYNKYLGKYIKTIETYKTPKGVAFALANGSGFHYRKNANPENWRGNLYLTFCVHYKNCKNIKDTGSPWSTYYDGKEKFHFDEVGIPITVAQSLDPDNYSREMTRDELIENCKTSHYKCVGLIQHDGWKIKDDYPIKL